MTACQHGSAVTAAGPFGPYCLACYEAAVAEDAAAGVTITTPQYR